MKKMERDIPNGIVIVLIVLVLVASIVGTWIVIDKTSPENIESGEFKGSSGNIGFRIIEDGPQGVASSGNVGFTKTK
ncbi:hypothetical protein ACFLZ6_01885 [Nanoarchaeota archaeon]